MTIRLAKIDELDQICKLNTAVMENINQSCDDDLIPNFAQTEIGKKYFTESVKDTESCFLVAEENDQLVGYVNGGVKIIPYRQSRYFEIDNLGVLPEYSRQKLGTKLLEAITTWAQKHGYQKIYIESYAKNTDAINFYKHHGLSEINISLEKHI